jgi:hypothetical protein
MTERTETTVITPMITPRRVSPDRSLFRRSAWSETANSSERPMAPADGGQGVPAPCPSAAFLSFSDILFT